MNLLMRRVTVITSALVLLGAVTGAGLYEGGMFNTPANQVKPADLPVVASNLPVLDNSCKGGTVTFTFDDGPDVNTMTLLSTLKAEHVPAIFFTIGDKVAKNPAIVRAEVQNGFRVEDHTWDHQSFTGQSTHTKALTDAQVRAELQGSINAITTAGLPRPKLWRAPYDDVNAHDVAIAKSLGLTLVMSYGSPPQNNIVDSNDWQAKTPQQAAAFIINGSVWNPKTGATTVATPTEKATAEAAFARNPSNGYLASDGNAYVPGISGGAVLGFHDGTHTAPIMIQSIPIIVRYMNAHHLCATSNVPANDLGLPTNLNAGGGG